MEGGLVRARGGEILCRLPGRHPRSARRRQENPPVRSRHRRPAPGDRCGGCADGSVWFWNSKYRRPHAHANLQNRSVITWRFSPDSRWIVVLESDHSVKRWRAMSLDIQEPLLQLQGNISMGLISEDCRLL